MCKDLLQAQLSCNHLVINILQNLLFCIAKTTLLASKNPCFARQNRLFCNEKQLILGVMDIW